MLKNYKFIDLTHTLDENIPVWLNSKRFERNIVGIGIDTLSLDPGLDKTFATHHTMLPNSKYQLENLTNLDQLPATGATVFVMPVKISNAPEAPARIIAVIAN